jgi:hypothetical protein
VRFATKSLIVLGGALALLALAWMVFLPRVVEHELRSITGFDFKVVVLTANPLTGKVAVHGLSVSNPPDFPKRDFVLLRDLNAQVELFPLFSGRRVVDKFDLSIETIVLVRRHDGKTNAGVFLAAFSPPKPAGAGVPENPPPPKAPAKTTPYLIKRLHIVLDRLVVADYSGEKPDEKTYNLHIDRIYNNVTSARQLLVPDVVETLRSFGLRHDVTSLIPGDMGKVLAGALGDAAQVGGGVKDAVKKAGEGLKGLFEKLEQTPKQ